jgi:NodT family efflux transporter outer membrane factor (OMF) lipoprotein
MRRTIIAGLLGAATLAGCTVGPNYHPPETPTPAAFAEPQPAPASGATIDPATWWSAFGDAELDKLVGVALKGNPNMAIAASRVREARLQLIVAKAQDKPTVNADVDVNHIQFSKNAGFASLASLFGGGSSGGASPPSGIALPGDGITTYSLGFDASWEIDLFGGARRGVQAARAQAEAAVWNQRDAAVTLAAEVAQAYFTLRMDQEQLAVLAEELDRQHRALDIAGHIAKVGLVPQVDVTRQHESITSLEARVQPIAADARVRIHALGILTGEQPEMLIAELDQTGAPLGAVPVIPAGLPSDLLRRRPDVRAAERGLAASTAEIGVAVSDLYPKFSLTGMADLVSAALGNIFSADSAQLTGTAAATFPILDWGRRKANVGAKKEEREQAYQNYRITVLQALKDVEDQLAQLDAERKRNATLRQAQSDAEHAASAVEAQYKTGFVAQDSLLNAEVTVLTAREQVVASDATLRQDTAGLFKAMGGGWSE